MTSYTDDDDLEEIFEVAISDEDGDEYFYWVETDDQDIAVEIAVDKHAKLNRPEPVDDFDEGTFPMAYEPPVESNRKKAVKILKSK